MQKTMKLGFVLILSAMLAAACGSTPNDSRAKQGAAKGAAIGAGIGL